MVRLAGGLIAGLALIFVSNMQAADTLPVGKFKIMSPPLGGDKALWIIKLETKEAKTTGSLVSQSTGMELPPGAKVEDVSTSEDLLRFNLKFPKAMEDPEPLELKFEIKMTKEKGGKWFGNAAVPNDQLIPIEIEPTQLTDLEPFTVAKETVAKAAGTDTLAAALILIRQAEQKKATSEEIAAWAHKAVKSAEIYGDRMLRQTLIRVAEPLANKETYAKIALPYIQRAEKMLDAKKDPVTTQKKVLTLLTAILEKAGKTEEAKAVRIRNDKLAYVTAVTFEGRKSKSDRVVLAELFSTAETPQVVAAELAVDGLNQTYKPSEIAVVRYYTPAQDPLANDESRTRLLFYGRKTPFGSLAINGKLIPGQPGFVEQAQEQYVAYKGMLEPLLEKPAKAKLTIVATRKGDKVEIKADVSALAETGDDVKLRLVLVEDDAIYKGASTLSNHRYLARAFPGGVMGITLKEKAATKTVTIDLTELKKTLTASLDKVPDGEKIPAKDRPMELKKLSVVAFVQNGDTLEVLQAAIVEVKGE